MKFNDRFFKKRWVSYSIATCTAVMLFMILSHLGDILESISGFFDFVRPVISGIIVAYVFNPFSNFFDRKVFHKIGSVKLRWTLSVIFTLITIFLGVILLFVALIPQLAESAKYLISNMDTYLATLQGFMKNLESGTAVSHFFGLNLDLTALYSFGDTIIEKLNDYFSNNMGSLVQTTSNAGRGILDAILAFILAIYFLFDKRRISNNSAKLMQLLMSRQRYEAVTSYLARCNVIIIKYISVDIIDGIAVGVMNFIFMLIMNMPYSVLISFIVGVTNLAPTFGPIVGAVLGGFILVLVEPWQALVFLLFTIALQTVDGYILKPRLFGGSLGVSSLMIMIAIILGGRLFGVTGILIAIPFAAILDFTWKDFVIKKLEERHAKRYNE